MLEKLMVIYGASLQSSKPFLVAVHGPRGVKVLQMVLESTYNHELSQWTGEP